ncbi:MAG TPA: hypothetical protein VEL76_08370 [Gemmataceae bacterium]|nr:hypothetical protein [Gemmataceae bacterium]
MDNQGAQGRAASRAEAALRYKLEIAYDVVPCPACGWIQQHMFPKARRAFRAWMRQLGVILLFLFMLVALPAAVIVAHLRPGPAPVIIFGVIAATVLCGIAAVTLLIGKVIQSNRYDPNGTDQESRIREGRSRGLLREELEKNAPASGACRRRFRRRTRPEDPLSEEPAP